jgi:hypothetical protein
MKMDRTRREDDTPVRRYRRQVSQFSQRAQARLARLITSGRAWGTRGIARVRQQALAVWHAGYTAARAVQTYPLWRLVWKAVGNDAKRAVAFLEQHPHYIHRGIISTVVIFLVLWVVPQWQVAGRMFQRC